MKFIGAWDSKNPEHAEKVLSHLSIYIYCNYCDCSDGYVQVRIEMGISDKKWNALKENIASTIYNLGDQFRPTLRTAWKEYIREMNAADILGHAPLAFEENMLVVKPDDPACSD